MNVRRILLIGLILVAAVASLSIVTADSSVSVGVFNFNIPDGYIEDETATVDDKSGHYTIKDEEIQGTSSYKKFENGNDIIEIRVTELNSPDDAKKVYDYYKGHVNGTTKTINGHEGILYGTDGIEFDYCKDNYYISVASTDESLVESIIPK